VTDPIRISRDELEDPSVDEALAREAAYRGEWGGGEGGEEVGRVRRKGGDAGKGGGEGLYLQSVLITGLLALLGGLIGWGIFEPYQHDDVPKPCPVCEQDVPPDEAQLCSDCGRAHHSRCWVEGDPPGGEGKQPYACGACGGKEIHQDSALLNLAMIPCIIALVACFVGAADGLMNRAFGRAATSAGVGLAVGLAAGIVTTIVAAIVYGIGNVGIFLAINAFNQSLLHGGLEEPPLWLVLGNMSARSAAWAAFGVAAGIAPGLLQRSRDLVMVGILGGLVGGFLGGICFDPIAQLFGGGEASRAVGFGFTGLCTGLSIGLVEQLSKDAWLYMEAGPLVGKQFVLYRDPTRVGSSPKCDIYIFKDSEVSPEHAYLRRVGATHELEAAPDAVVLLNGKRAGRERLKDGDLIAVGKARLRYYVRSKKRSIR
jgi:hypothetical protein